MARLVARVVAPAAALRAEEGEDLSGLPLLLTDPLSELVRATDRRGSEIFGSHRLGQVVGYPARMACISCSLESTGPVAMKSCAGLSSTRYCASWSAEILILFQVQDDQLGPERPQRLDLLLAELVERHGELQLQRNGPIGAAQELLDLGHEAWSRWRSARRGEAGHQSRGGCSSPTLMRTECVCINESPVVVRQARRHPWTYPEPRRDRCLALPVHSQQGRLSRKTLAKLLNSNGIVAWAGHVARVVETDDHYPRTVGQPV